MSCKESEGKLYHLQCVNFTSLTFDRVIIICVNTGPAGGEEEGPAVCIKYQLPTEQDLQRTGASDDKP